MYNPEVVEFRPVQNLELSVDAYPLELDIEFLGVVDVLIGYYVQLAVVENVEGETGALFLAMDFCGDFFEVLRLELQQIYFVDDLGCQLVNIENIGLVVLKFLQVAFLLKLVFYRHLILTTFIPKPKLKISISSLL